MPGDTPLKAGATAPGRWHARGAMLLLCLAVSYNFPLAIINARGLTMDRTIVIGVEAVLMGFGLLLAVSRWRPEMTRWVLMIGAFLALSLVLSQFRQTFDPKSFRDTLMFAVFVMTGMLVTMRDARNVLVGLQAVILVVMLVEVSIPETYGAIVDPRAYFIASRGFSIEQLAGDSNLFGAVRPDERYLLPQLGWNRASSIFLEPLSLGNYASFAALATVVHWRQWSVPVRLFMVASTLLVLIGSDGRFAGVSTAGLVLLAPLLSRLPVLLAALYLPLAVLAGRLASLGFDWNPKQDTFPGRIARGMKALFQLDGYDLAGFTIPTPALADSGIAYLVMSQSLPGVVLLQVCLYWHIGLRRADQRLYLHGTALTFALSILVSISMLSIKTAGFYWFLVGAMIVLPQQQKTRQYDRPAGIAVSAG